MTQTESKEEPTVESPSPVKAQRKKKCCSLWLDRKEYGAFQSNTERIYGKKKSVSDRINEFMAKSNRDDEGKNPEVSLDDAIADVRGKLQDSLIASQKLGKIWSGTGGSAKRRVADFVSFSYNRVGIPRLSRNNNLDNSNRLDALIDQLYADPDLLLKFYKFTPTGNGDIPRFLFDAFVMYLEEKIKQTRLQDMLSDLRAKKLRINLDNFALSGSFAAPKESSAPGGVNVEESEADEDVEAEEASEVSEQPEVSSESTIE